MAEGAQGRGARRSRPWASDLDPDARVSALPAAERSLVAIGRALAVKSDILVLDEPTAALPEADVERLLDALRRLRASGIGIIYVTHRLDEVFRIADRVTVLRDGRRVATVAVGETSPADLVEKIVGRSMTDAFVKPAPASDRTVLAVDGRSSPSMSARSPSRSPPARRSAWSACAAPAITPSGARSSARCRARRRHDVARRRAASIRPIRPTPCASGIGFVSSRRAEESLAANMAVRENLYMNPVGDRESACSSSIGRAGSESADSLAVLQALLGQGRRIPSSRSPRSPAATSRRWWSPAGWRRRCSLLVLEEPTIGVDVGSKAEIYHLLQRSLIDGLAVLLISSDFEEVERICHRALVFSRGRVVAEIPRDELTIARLTAIASGGASRPAGSAA